nr:armadillo-type fold [Tanacetum cinerariifolium]
MKRKKIRGRNLLNLWLKLYNLKLLKEILLMYGPSVHVLVRKDVEFSSRHGGGIFHHILGSFLPHSRNSKREKRTYADWRHELAEVNNAFSDFADNGKVQQSPGNDIQAFVDMLDDVLVARSRARSPIGSLISGEASATFIDVGLVDSTSSLNTTSTPHVIAGSLWFDILMTRLPFIT